MKLLNKLIIITLAIWFFALPIIFIPGLSPWIDFSKKILSMAITAILLVLWSAQTAQIGVIRFKLTPLTPFILFFGVWVFFSSLLSNNIMDSLWMSSPILISIFIYLVILNTIEHEEINRIFRVSLISGGVFISLLSLAIEFQGLFTPSPPVSPTTGAISLSFLLNKNFSLTGSPLVQVSFLILIIPLVIAEIFGEKTKSEENRTVKLNPSQRIVSIIILVIISLSILLTCKNLLEKGANFLDWTSSWKVSIASLTIGVKEVLFGSGTGNFSTVFTRFRPQELNLTKFWNLRFETSHSEWLNILVSNGIIGLILFIILQVKLISQAINPFKITSFVCFIFLFLSLFFPLSPLIWLIFFPLIIITPIGNKESREKYTLLLSKKKSSYTKNQLPLLALILFIISIIISGTIGFLAYRLTIAEYHYQASFRAQAKNDINLTYDYQNLTIVENPFNEEYKRSFAKTNLAIANALSQKQDLTDKEKNQILIYIQLAIQEGKKAVVLNPSKSENLETLSDIYLSLQGSLQGADTWALTSLRDAISINSTYPDLYIKRGGVYLQKKAYDQAIKEFQTAVDLKPDHANAHYNLAYAYQSKKDFTNAENEIREVLRLIPENSTEYEIAKKDLNSIKMQVDITNPNNATPSGIPETENPKPAIKSNTPTPTPTSP